MEVFKQAYTIILFGSIFFSINAYSQGLSPYQLKPAIDYTIGGTSLSLLTTAFLLDKQVTPLSYDKRLQLNTQSILYIDRFAIRYWNPKSAKVSDILLFAGMGLPATLLASRSVRKDWTKILLIGAQSYSLSLALTNFFKTTVQRNRPFVYNQSRHIPSHYLNNKDSRYAFFSGHTSMTAVGCFFSAKVFNDYYPKSRYKWLVWTGVASLPLLTGILRVRSGKHFPTDVITGYFIGALIGILLPEIYRI